MLAVVKLPLTGLSETLGELLGENKVMPNSPLLMEPESVDLKWNPVTLSEKIIY